MDFGQLPDETSLATCVLGVKQGVETLACGTFEKERYESDLRVKVPHAAEAFHQSKMPIVVFTWRVGSIAQ